MRTSGNLFGDLPLPSQDEEIVALLSAPGVRIERIVSTGQASPPDFWYDQDWAEWVMVVSGAAQMRFEAEPEFRRMEAGDYLLIPAHCRHRVEWTDPSVPTIWLAIHFDQGRAEAPTI
ncbi:cupin domain-containing protein [Magnetospirillum molischianum]|nr:cupin domain-containing protein [Magnetospirillum molischianum]